MIRAADLASPAWAERHSQEMLGGLPVRWAHSVGVARKAAALGGRFRLEERDVLVAAAYLHDIGYAPALAVSGFHPLDGARHLGGLGLDRLAGLVAYHSGAAEAASLRGVSEALRDFVREDSEIARLLDYCDLTVGPAGEDMEPAQRLAEVEARYGADHLVSRSLRLAWPRLSEEFHLVASCLETAPRVRATRS